MKKSPVILLHKDELKNIDIDVKSVKSLDKSIQPVHRDDHYMFIIQQEGSFLWELDFNKIMLSGPSLCFIIPGQVHRYVDHQNCEGWLIFVNTDLISNQYREIFATYVHIHQLVSVQKNNAIFEIVPVLENVLSQKFLPLRKPLINSLVETLTGLIASSIVQSQNSANLIGGQKYNTVIRFKQLVIEKCREIKQVKGYASLLHITPLYLNEVVKEITGFSASYWIYQEILLEAKRMLYYTSLDIKQIAYELGYEDHAYFSRFFRKNTGLTASAFRNTEPLFVQS